VPERCSGCGDIISGLIKCDILGRGTVGWFDKKSKTYHRFYVKEEEHKYRKLNSYGIDVDIASEAHEKWKANWFKVHSTDTDGMLRCRTTPFDFLLMGERVEEQDDPQLHVPLSRFKVVAQRPAPKHRDDDSSRGAHDIEIICIKCNKTATRLAFQREPTEEEKVCNHCKEPKQCIFWCNRCFPMTDTFDPTKEDVIYPIDFELDDLVKAERKVVVIPREIIDKVHGLESYYNAIFRPNSTIVETPSGKKWRISLGQIETLAQENKYRFTFQKVETYDGRQETTQPSGLPKRERIWSGF
jgi:hypothetical protein